MELPALTVGMATYDDYNGVYFTLQALRMYQDLAHTELLVIDNFGCQHTKAFVEAIDGARYVLATEVVGTAAPKDLIFREARGEAVLCGDSHVLFAPGAIRQLREYYHDNPASRDLLQGPLVNDNFDVSTHFDPVWRGQMWGTWATDPRGQDPEGQQFEIPMQGMGRLQLPQGRMAWVQRTVPGLRRRGGLHPREVPTGRGRCLCLPWLRWMHRFVRPAGVPYPLTVEDKLRNYVIGHAELGLDVTPVLTHFRESLPEDRVVAVTAEALWGPTALQSTPATRREVAPEAAVATAPGGTQSAFAFSGEYPPVSCVCTTYGRPELLERRSSPFCDRTTPARRS